MSTAIRPHATFGTEKKNTPGVLGRSQTMYSSISSNIAMFVSLPITMQAFLALITALAAAQGHPDGDAHRGARGRSPRGEPHRSRGHGQRPQERDVQLGDERGRRQDLAGPAVGRVREHERPGPHADDDVRVPRQRHGGQHPRGVVAVCQYSGPLIAPRASGEWTRGPLDQAGPDAGRRRAKNPRGGASPFQRDLEGPRSLARNESGRS
jgi:hypothetical protein